MNSKENALEHTCRMLDKRMCRWEGKENRASFPNKNPCNLQIFPGKIEGFLTCRSIVSLWRKRHFFQKLLKRRRGFPPDGKFMLVLFMLFPKVRTGDEHGQGQTFWSPATQPGPPDSSLQMWNVQKSWESVWGSLVSRWNLDGASEWIVVPYFNSELFNPNRCLKMKGAFNIPWYVPCTFSLFEDETCNVEFGPGPPKYFEACNLEFQTLQ